MSDNDWLRPVIYDYPFTSHYLPLDCGRLHYLDEGTGPVLLLVHGNPSVAGGQAAWWWRQVAGAGGVAYEAYYDARRITRMGAVAGNRRMRLGMRNALRLFETVQDCAVVCPTPNGASAWLRSSSRERAKAST